MESREKGLHEAPSTEGPHETPHGGPVPHLAHAPAVAGGLASGETCLGRLDIRQTSGKSGPSWPSEGPAVLFEELRVNAAAGDGERAPPSGSL